MTRAASTSSTSSRNPDAALHDLVRRYNELRSRGVEITNVDEDDPRLDALNREADELAISILTTPISTEAAKRAKGKVAIAEDLTSYLFKAIELADQRRVAARRAKRANADTTTAAVSL